MFKFIIDCQNPRVGFCDKAKTNLDLAGQIVSEAITLKEPVVVDAKFEPLGLLLGQAAPSQVIGLRNEDGAIRMYPQSLIKQFKLDEDLELLPVDIIAKFNSERDYWFEGDTTPIMPTQLGFVELTIHELMHGLGIISSWGPNLQTAADGPEIRELTPYFQFNSTNIFYGFFETIFDRFILELPSGKKSSELTAELNTVAPKGTTFDSMYDFVVKFRASAQYEIATDMLKTSTTPLSLGFLPKCPNFQKTVKNNTANGHLLYLETSVRPFMLGSNIIHVSQDLYEDTPEFMMTLRQIRGRGLKEAISETGSSDGEAIGPMTRCIFESMGYTTANIPIPEIPDEIITIVA